jgi:hypothetical protein
MWWSLCPYAFFAFGRAELNIQGRGSFWRKCAENCHTISRGGTRSPTNRDDPPGAWNFLFSVHWFFGAKTPKNQ